jgi:thiol-disulfide isomerase/thioredoxin
MEGNENYVLVFWSSTCGHCLRELPALHKRLKNNTSIKVIAIGLEDDDIYWKMESEKLEDFEHAIALGKWDSEYADLYGIVSTPSYFILDKDKHIIAKPENDKGVIEFLEKN